LILVWRVHLANLDPPAFRHIELGSDTRFDSLMFGCALALYENPALDSSAIREGFWKRLLLPLGLLGLLASFTIREEVFRQTFRYTLQGLSLVPIFVCAVRYPNWWPMRPLNWRPVAFVGVLSYSLYLMHQVVLSVFYHNLPPYPQAVLTLLALFATILLAFVVYELIEKPCAKLRRSLRV
jgi:peptidoglycan/LPS O-acetylase OafA/YrhL